MLRALVLLAAPFGTYCHSTSGAAWSCQKGLTASQRSSFCDTAVCEGAHDDNGVFLQLRSDDGLVGVPAPRAADVASSMPHGQAAPSQENQHSSASTGAPQDAAAAPVNRGGRGEIAHRHDVVSVASSSPSATAPPPVDAPPSTIAERLGARSGLVAVAPTASPAETASPAVTIAYVIGGIFVFCNVILCSTWLTWIVVEGPVELLDATERCAKRVRNVATPVVQVGATFVTGVATVAIRSPELCYQMATGNTDYETRRWIQVH